MILAADRPAAQLAHSHARNVSLSTSPRTSLAVGITVYELARIMGTSVGMIEAHYGALLDAAHESLLERLEVGREIRS